MEQFFTGLFRGGGGGAAPRGPPPPPIPDFFPSFAMQQQQQQQQQQQTVPPAKASVVRQLPVVKIRAQDLIDPCNRECCICLEAIRIHDTVTRMPCAHYYHPTCLRDWLSRNCTCPICRLELPTDNALYERGRLQRMIHRRPRYARHELERMKIGQLKKLGKNRVPVSVLDKKELIEFLIHRNCVELVVGGESDPVSYKLSELKQLSVKRLKHIMNEQAGVFFDPKDVIEKNDMITIFRLSGRLDVIPEDEPPEASDDADPSNLVETVYSDTEEEGPPNNNVPHSSDVLMEEDEDFLVRDLDTLQNTNPSGTSFANATAELPLEAMDVVTNDVLETMQTEQGEEEEVEDSKPAARVLGTTSDSGERNSTHDYTTAPPDAFLNLTVERIRELSDGFGLDLSEQIARREAVDRDIAFQLAHAAAQSTVRRCKRPRGGAVNGSCGEQKRPEQSHSIPLNANMFKDCSVSDVRAISRLVDVPVWSNDYDAIVEALQEAAVERPHVARYLNALEPLVSKTVPQLQAIARSWQVSIADCLEKGEILHRLVLSKVARE